MGEKFANTFVKGLEHAQLNKKKIDDSIFFFLMSKSFEQTLHKEDT